MKIALDTNVLVSALTTRGLCAELFEQIIQNKFLVISKPVLVELERILTDKFGLPEVTVHGYLNLIQEEAKELLVANQKLKGIPDPDDVEILAFASGSGAEIFVTGDKALLKLKAIENMLIISPRQCWQQLRSGE